MSVLVLTWLPVALGNCSVYVKETASNPCSWNPTDPNSALYALANGCSKGILKRMVDCIVSA